MSSDPTSGRVIILIPVFNDWESAQLLLTSLDRALADFMARVEIVFADDGSSLAVPDDFATQPLKNIGSVSILRLRRNLGHQRAIATGLVYLYQNTSGRAVVVMDGDGQDRPQDVPRLLKAFEEHGGRSIVFAARAKRLERWVFRLLYHAYRLIHSIVTGDPVRVGNFSVVPFGFLSRLAVTPEMWSHYAAAVIRTRIPFTTIPIDRGARLAGESRMNFVDLLLHGLSAFFVYGEIMGARLLVAIGCVLLAGSALAGIFVAARLTSGVGLAGGVAYGAGFLAVILLLAMLIALILIFTVIGSRANLGFLPIRDCGYFVEDIRQVFPAEESVPAKPLR